ncbi:hypothetical protein L3X38_011055 [Prunus dulcis]|uniref:Uncharacterized protein n=1 Tax=Prunus dulcis TaxID=3755 RepID=A0AAD4ZES5_PRUDU|nr:hypothetical protein L3X38_011055 [Prunus dulcis]
MSSEDGSKSTSSQVYKKRFVANLHRVTTEAHFQRWRATYASAILDDVHIKLAKPLTDDVPCVNANDPNARIITVRPFYFSLGFKFTSSKLFKEVFWAMGCAPSQCTPNVYWAIMCFENLSLLHVGADVLVMEITCGTTMCWKSVDDGRSTLAMVHLFPSPIAMQEIEAWTGHGSRMVRTLMIYLLDKRSALQNLGLIIWPAGSWAVMGFEMGRAALGRARLGLESKPPSKRKADVKSSRTQATSSQARNVSPLRKKPNLPSTEKTQVGAILASSAMVKHLVGADSKKIGSMHNIRDVPLKALAGEFGDRDLLCKVVRGWFSSLVKRQKDADAPLQSSGRLHQTEWRSMWEVCSSIQPS